MNCSCEMCQGDMATANAHKKQHRDAMAERIMLTLLTTESWTIQRGSGHGGLDGQSSNIASLAYMLADYMIQESNKAG